MRTRQRGRAVTLLELMAVITLLSLGVGLTTLNTRGASDMSRLRAAALQIGAVYRLAALEATRSGMPRALLLEPTQIAVKKPAHLDGAWRWSVSPPVALVRKVRIVDAYPAGGVPGRLGAQMGWEIAVEPRDADTGWAVVLTTSRNTQETVHISARGAERAERRGNGWETAP